MLSKRGLRASSGDFRDLWGEVAGVNYKPAECCIIYGRQQAASKLSVYQERTRHPVFAFEHQILINVHCNVICMLLYCNERFLEVRLFRFAVTLFHRSSILRLAVAFRLFVVRIYRMPWLIVTKQSCLESFYSVGNI